MTKLTTKQTDMLNAIANGNINVDGVAGVLNITKSAARKRFKLLMEKELTVEVKFADSITWQLTTEGYEAISQKEEREEEREEDPIIQAIRTASKPKTKKAKKAHKTSDGKPCHCAQPELHGKRTSAPGCLQHVRQILSEGEVERKALIELMVSTYGPKAKWATMNYIAKSKKGKLVEGLVTVEVEGVLSPSTGA